MYWPKVQHLMRDQLRRVQGVDPDRYLIVHVFWSGTWDNGYEIGGLKDLDAGAYFNFDLATAHQTGRGALAGILRAIGEAVPEAGDRQVPITLMCESTGARLVVSAAERLKEDPTLAPWYATVANIAFDPTRRLAKTPLRIAMIHPALRQLDIATLFQDDPCEEVQRADAGGALGDHELLHPYAESPILSELDLLGVASRDGSECRVFIAHSTFDKAGLAFASGQRSDPNFEAGKGGTSERLYTTMLGRHGLSAPNTAAYGRPYVRSASRVQMAAVMVGAHDGQGFDPSETDYWHVDLWGWKLPDEPAPSRYLWDRNVPEHGGQPFDLQFDGQSWYAGPDIGDAADVGLEVTGMTETPPWNLLTVSRSHLDRAWGWLGRLVVAGQVAAP